LVSLLYHFSTLMTHGAPCLAQQPVEHRVDEMAHSPAYEPDHCLAMPLPRACSVCRRAPGSYP
jgi:hypothetical protein